jgi:hypothetical protein
MSFEEREFSGEVKLRMPTSLHRDLAMRAHAEGVSLNQFACAALAGTVGWNAGSAFADEGSSTAERRASPGDEAFEKAWLELHS